MEGSLVNVLLLALISASSARPQAPVGRVITRHEARDRYGQYALQYYTPDGTLVRSQGALKKSSTGRGLVLVHRGSYRYTAPDGTPVEVHYTADERGYRPVSRNIPQPPRPLHA